MVYLGHIGRPQFFLQTPICSKWWAIWVPKYMSSPFFHKTDPLKLVFCVKIYHNYSTKCGYHVDVLIYNCQNEQQSQGAWNLPNKFHLYLIIYYLEDKKDHYHRTSFSRWQAKIEGTVEWRNRENAGSRTIASSDFRR